MKILEVTPRCYVPGANVERWTGLDYVTSQIACGLAERGHKVEIAMPFKFDEAGRLGENLDIAFPGGFVEWCSSVLSKGNIGKCIKDVKEFGLREAVRDLAYKGYIAGFSKLLDDFAPDVVHVHGSTRWSYECLRTSFEAGYSCVATFHGINRDNPMCSRIVKRVESQMIDYIAEKAIPYTAVSSGTLASVKEIASLACNCSSAVIPNSVFIKQSELTKEEAREKLGVPHENEVIVCIGTIGERKNQAALVDAIASASTDERRNLSVFLVGKDLYPGGILSYIEKKGVQDCVLATGFVKVEEIADFYAAADLNIMLSKSEGFGLSIIEAMSCGIPSLVASTVDSSADINTSEAMRCIDWTTSRELFCAIKDMLETKWDTEQIRQDAQRFSPDEMISSYERVLHGSR